MSNFIPLRSSLPRKGRHWSQNVRESLLLRAPNTGNFNLHVEGGAENGEFICVGDIRQDRIKYKRGKLHPGDIILEINQIPVAGYTQYQLMSLISDSKDALELRTVKQGDQITRDLQKFLSTTFEKNSLDSDLQQTIRDNLYNTTVPCTTRSPRPGEVPGEDYIFLSVEMFLELERSGNLLESGIYGGNHYGTPKPPKVPGQPILGQLNTRSNHTESDRWNQSNNFKSQDSLGPLPPNWEIAYTEDNIKYFIDHSTGSTQWVDPRLARVKKASAEECDEDELPYGWERVDDPKYGTYYIDHVNRKTQFENPVQAHRRQSQSNSMSYAYSSAPPPHQGPPSLQSAAALAKKQEAEAYSRWPDVEFSHSQPPAYTVNSIGHQPRSYPYSNDGRQLQGEVIRTELLKGSRGFGFTIVGGDQIGELLQIKSIVPDGAAAKDGQLRTGDALVKVNGMSVLSKSHQDVVGMFQSMPLGEAVELEVIRGYPLPFDPDDPNVETIGSYTVVRGPPMQSESPLQPLSMNNGSAFSQPPRNNQFGNRWSNPSGEPMESPIAPLPGYISSTFPRTSTTNSLPRNSPEILTIPVVKGPMGFGFTIADSPYGQKVKQIMDAPRCQGLLEGDILVEINGHMIRSCTHNEAVNILKECPKGQEAAIVVQRGGMPTPLKNSPAFGRKDNPKEQEFVASRVARPKSTPVTSSNHVRYDQHGGSTGNLATAGESTRNQETGHEFRNLGQPTLDRSSEALFKSYPSLKRAVANAARRSMENLAAPDVDPLATQDSSTFNVHLKRGEMGFGFRIIGGQEENTQVAIGTIVRGGSADLDHRLMRGDEIHYIDGISVIGATHRRVISLMGNAAIAGEVTLGICRIPNKSGRATPTGSLRRSVSASSELSEGAIMGHTSRQASQSTGNLNHYGREPIPDKEETASVHSFHSTPAGDTVSSSGRSQRSRRHSESDAKAEPQGPVYYRDVTIHREENESFGFVIFSSVQKSGSTIGRIIQGSPADRCRQLHVGDRLLAVNGVDIVGVHHGDIVDTIKQSGRTVTLRIAQQRPLDNFETRKLSRMSAPDLSKANTAQSGVSRGRDTDEWNRENAYSEQGSLERTRNDQRYHENYPRMQSQPAKVPPKVPPRVAPKPSREKVLMAQEERRRQQSEYSDSRRQSSPDAITRPPPPIRDNRDSMKEDGWVNKQVFEVELSRDSSGYGFSIRGGRELDLPIFVLRMAEGGAAHRDGRLKIGDEIVEINGTSTAEIAHADAISLIKSGGNRVRLRLQRTNKPVYLDAIPNGGPAMSGANSLPRTSTWKTPTYNAMYQY